MVWVWWVEGLGGNEGCGFEMRGGVLVVFRYTGYKTQAGKQPIWLYGNRGPTGSEIDL